MQMCIGLTCFTLLIACADDDGNATTDLDATIWAGAAWDEANPDQGELSGDLAAPTPITLGLGDNLIQATSVPAATEQCIGNPENPDALETPYYPEHVTYTDAFTFTLPADQKLASHTAVVQRSTAEPDEISPFSRRTRAASCARRWCPRAFG